MKRTGLFAVIMAFLLVITACGREEAKTSQVNGDASKPPALLKLNSEVLYDETTNKLSTTVTMTNPNENPVNVTFNSSQRFQLTVLKENEIVFDYGSEYMFTEAILEEEWGAGEKKVFDEVFPLELENGNYTVEIISLGQVEGAPEIAVTTQETFTVKGRSSTDDKTESTPQTAGAFRDVLIKWNDASVEVSGFTEEEEFEWAVSDGHNIFAQGAAEVTGGGFSFGILLDEAPDASQPLFLEMTPIGGETTSFRMQ